MRIIDLTPRDTDLIRQAAQLLVDGFRDFSPEAWPDLPAALEEMTECLSTDRICRAALAEGDELLGFIGGISQYNGNVWELHPLVVREDHRGHGIGTLLVSDLEEQVRRRTGRTIWLGTDDESGLTTLAGVDLFTEPWKHLERVANRTGRRHPFSFYQKLGYTVVGVMPEANGPGKPDIHMAKRVAG